MIQKEESCSFKDKKEFYCYEAWTSLACAFTVASWLHYKKESGNSVCKNLQRRQGNKTVKFYTGMQWLEHLSNQFDLKNLNSKDILADDRNTAAFCYTANSAAFCYIYHTATTYATLPIKTAKTQFLAVA